MTIIKRYILERFWATFNLRHVRNLVLFPYVLFYDATQANIETEELQMKKVNRNRWDRACSGNGLLRDNPLIETDSYIPPTLKRDQ